METKRYEELYKLAKEQVASEQARFTRLETKATQYLAALTFLIGLSAPVGIAAVKVLLPPSSFVSWLMLNLLVVIFVGLVIVWFLAFSVIKISATRACPLNDEVIRFYSDNSDVDVFYGMSKAFSAAWKENLAINEEKGRKLTEAHQGIRILVCLIAAFGALSFFGLKVTLCG